MSTRVFSEWGSVDRSVTAHLSISSSRPTTKEQRRLRSVFADSASGLINRMPEANGVDEDACWPNVQQNEVKHR